MEVPGVAKGGMEWPRFRDMVVPNRFFERTPFRYGRSRSPAQPPAMETA